MDVLTVSKAMNSRIIELETLGKELNRLADNRASTSATYAKMLAMTIIQLRNGTKFIFKGQEVENPPVSIMEKIAKGICWEEQLKMDIAEFEHKNQIELMDKAKSQLNGYQSINKFLADID